MNVIWRKVWRDLAHSKARTSLVVLSTAVGLFAVGLVFGLSTLLSARMTQDHQMTNPAHITFWGGLYNSTVVDVVLQDADVAEAENEIRTSLRWKLEGETDWRNGDLIVRVDYRDQHMNLIQLLDGNWPTERTLALERQSSRYFGIPVGTMVTVEFGRGERHLPIEGIVRESGVTPPQFGGDAAFYTTPDTAAWLTGLELFNRLNVRLTSFSQEATSEVAERIEDRLERMGLPRGGHDVTDPGVHPMQEMIGTLSVILAGLGALSLGLSAFLTVNTTHAIVVQQVWQIGVMKVIGATLGRVASVYLMTALIYGLLASLVAVPLGVAGVHLMAGWLLDMINIDRGPFQAVPVAAMTQVGIGLALPTLAALVPVLGGARITPHQAISTYGLGGGFGRGWIDRAIGRVRHLPRPLALSLRNTFRRKVRVALTLITLVLGGVMFIMVMSVRDSMENTLEVLISDFGLDVWAVLERPYRAETLIEVAKSVPDVDQAEVWDQRPAALSLAHGEQRQVLVMGLPPASQMFDPRILAGRTLLPGDDRAILLNSKIATDEGIQVGDAIELTINERESIWTVVGFVLNVSDDQRNCFVPFDALARELGNVGRGTMVMVTSERHDVKSQQALMGNLRDAYVKRHVEPSFFQSSTVLREQNRQQFALITSLMLAMAVLAAIVGGVGLMGTMSINVVERRREIGVMRAIGATSLAIVGNLVTEGVLLGVLSWLLAAPLSYPGSRAFSDLVGNELMNVRLDFSYSIEGMILWLLIVVNVSALASLWPALRATRMSVHETLAYE